MVAAANSATTSREARQTVTDTIFPTLLKRATNGALTDRSHSGMAPKIYHLHPLVAGPLSQWSTHFARCRAMGFDTVCVAPPFAPGESGDIFITADHESLHPALDWHGTADEGIARVTRDAGEQGLRIWLDLSVDRVALDAVIRQRDEQWFVAGGCGALPNPLRSPRRLDVAY